MARNKKAGLVHGWGIVDVDYNVTRNQVVNGKNKRVWVCPYYRKWVHILERCLCPKFQKRRPTYKGCTVCKEWKYLSNFIKWVDSQPNRDWQNCEPDKDVLFHGNKCYSPETVVFVSRQVNSFITIKSNERCKYMIGVSDSGKYPKNKPYIARCNNPFTGEREYLGHYTTEIEAHLAWKSRKHEISCILADEQTDPRVAKILRERYTPDKDWTKA